MKKSNISQAIKQIEHLYSKYGQRSYEEKCTQLQHAQQCGTLAIEKGYNNQVVLAAFLHDIGHFVAEEQNNPENTDYGYAAHDQLGAQYLSDLGFTSQITELVAQHVKVKRYLASVVPDYINKLSSASLYTLKLQGGAMTAPEADLYAQTPHLQEIIQLRELDDSGKLPEKPCFPLSFWLELAEKELAISSDNSE